MRHLTRHFNILPILRKLENLQISPPSTQEINLYNKMDRILVKARTKANTSVRRLHMRNVHSYRTVKLDQLRIRLATLIIHSKYRGRRLKLKTVINMDNLTGRRGWLTIDIGTLINKKFRAKKDYQICKKERLTLMKNYCHKIRANGLVYPGIDLNPKIGQ